MRTVHYIDVSKMSEKEYREHLEKITGKKIPTFNWIVWVAFLTCLPLIFLAIAKVLQ